MAADPNTNKIFVVGDEDPGFSIIDGDTHSIEKIGFAGINPNILTVNRLIAKHILLTAITKHSI